MQLIKRFTMVIAVALCLSLFSISVCAEEEEIIFHGIGFVTMPSQHLYSQPASDS